MTAHVLLLWLALLAFVMAALFPTRVPQVQWQWLAAAFVVAAWLI